MNKLYTYISLLSCIVLMPGCLNFEEFEEPGQKVPKTFYAEMEAQPATKTVLGEKNAEGIRPVLWELKDKIGVAPSSGSQSTFDVFVNKTTELADTAIFEGTTVSASSYYAIYPYNESTKIQADSTIFTLNQFQSYKEASFDQGAFPMVARYSDTGANGFQFQNLCGVLEINLTGVEKIKSLTFKAKRPVCGQFVVGMKYETYPEMTASVLASNSVTLNCGKGVQLNESTPTPFYLVLPPAEYETFELIITTKDGKMMRKQSQKPLNIKRSYVIETGVLQYVEAEAIDLSLRGTANCYIVPSAGAYKFNASVIGNGEYGFVPDAEFHTSDPNISPSLVEVLWETKGANVTAEKGEVVANVSLTEDGYVDFYATGVEGNALVAVMDADSTILWSWHIWVTDQPADQHYVNSVGEFDVMDRNLGATRADRGVGDEWKESCGLDFQWGRKDPLSAYNFTESDQITTIAQSIMSPNIKATSWDFGPSKSLWSTSQKTIYDPCPPRYRTAPRNVWKDFSVQETSGSFDHGWNFIYDGTNTAWYPVRADHMESGINYWSDSYMAVADRNTGVYFSSTNFSNTRVRVGQTRCMKDDGYVDQAQLAVEIAGIDNVTSDSAIISIDIQRTGGVEVTECGVIYGTAPGVSSDNGTKLAATGEEYKVDLTGLTEGTKYYAIAYATNDFGTSYSKEVSFYTEFEGFVNLSQNGTSNCYVVSDAGSYIFDASVMGNSDDSVGELVDVEVLWETKRLTPAEAGEIITDVQLSGDYVTFEATGMEGNALIAVKDAAGVILWSWHIWVTDTPKDQFYYNGTGTFLVQDRNLGAIRADKGTGDVEWKDSFGMYYQWGRKDPFVAGLYTISDKKISLATSIAEPTVFPATDSHWLTSDDYELWNSSEKTIYDPCPPGYIIGSSNLWNSLRYQQIENVDKGWELMIDEVYRTWIPASSWIDVYGSPINHNNEVYLWSGTYNKSLHIYNKSIQVSSWMLNNGFAVRCMSEQGPFANLQTDSVTEVTKTSAVLNGSIEYLQDVIISEMGFLWSTSKEFIDANTLKVDVCEGKFSATLNNLKLGTTYYVRTYAIDNGRTVYGSSQNFMLQNADTGEDIPEGDEYEW